jgi:hypothetical protein
MSGSPAVDTPYIVSIKYNSTTGWRILRGTNDSGGGQANQPPGVGQLVTYGAESTVPADGNAGGVSHIAYDMNGVHYLGAGSSDWADNAYQYTTGTAQDVKDFWTPWAAHGYCHTSPGWSGG